MGEKARQVDRTIRYLMMKKGIDFTAAIHQYNDMRAAEQSVLTNEAVKAYTKQPF